MSVNGKVELLAQELVPATFPIFRFLEQPGALQKPPVDREWWSDILEIRVINDHPALAVDWGLLPSGEISYSQSFDVEAFSMLLAKIAHSFAIAEFGVGAFDPWLPELILGKSTKFPYHIGCSSVSQLGTPAATLLNWSIFAIEPLPLLAVTIHLFPFMGQPPVDVVVGSLSPNQFEHVAAQAGT